MKQQNPAPPHNRVTLDDLKNDTRKPSIAFFLPHAGDGGVERRFLKLIDYLNERGVVIDLVLAAYTGARLPSVPDGVRIIDLESRNHRNQLFKNAKLFARYLTLVEPDVAHCAVDRINVSAALGKFMSKSKTKLIIAQVTSIDLAEISWFKPTRILHYLSVRGAFPLADEYIAPSYGIADELRSLMFMGKKKITGIHNPLLAEFTPYEGPKKYISAEKPAIVAVGRLSHEKDYPTLLKAFTLILKEKDCHLYILGEGKERPHIEALIATLGISKNVSLVGFVDNSIEYMYESDVFVLPSVKEGFGMVVLEALVAGTKVVSTDCKHGPAEILDNEKYGRLVPIRDPNAMANAIIKTLDEPPRTPQEKEELQDYIAKFTYEKHAQKYIAALGLKL
tara:strand:+ start:694 stop:1872 length:1179 start_codon:yes stop_codon:yes gene_type:complete